jgi:hypothetical protein
MMARVDKQREAITEFEAILTAAGYADGYGLTDKQVSEATNPLFWRNSVPSVGAEKPLYLCFVLTDDGTAQADNKTVFGTVYIDIAIYYSDPYAFHSSDGVPSTTLKALEEGLENALWALEWDDEETIPSIESAGVTINIKHLTISKIL